MKIYVVGTHHITYVFVEQKIILYNNKKKYYVATPSYLELCLTPNHTCSVIWTTWWGWSDGVKVSCVLRYLGVQLILAYSWARPAILVAGKGRGGMFLFLLFLHFHSCSSFFPVPLFHLLCYIFYLFSPFHKMTYKGLCVIKPQHNQSMNNDSSWKHTYIILTPLKPHIYSKTGLYRGIHYFSYFCSKT